MKIYQICFIIKILKELKNVTERLEKKISFAMQANNLFYQKFLTKKPTINFDNNLPRQSFHKTLLKQEQVLLDSLGGFYAKVE